MALEQIDEAKRDGARIEAACQVVGICRRTYSRWKKLERESENIDRRSLQINPKIAQLRRLSPQEQDRVVEVCNEKRFSSLPPGQIVPTLADEGVYLCSESTMYRILHRRNQVTRRGRSRQRQKVSKPREVRVTGPGQCYCWDITFLPTLVVGVFLKLYCVLDLFSRKIVGWEIHETESSEHAKTLINKIRLRERIDPTSLVIHSDNGPAMKGQTLRSFLYALGVTSSYSRPGVSDDNPFSESIFRTLKYCRLFPEKPFESLESARDWMLKFSDWYNNHHLHSELKFVTPSQKHNGEDFSILMERDQLYQQSRLLNPLRWSGSTRDWAPVMATTLNPDKLKRPGRKSVKGRSGQAELSRARNAA